jgi:hypothetical protein
MHACMHTYIKELFIAWACVGHANIMMMALICHVLVSLECVTENTFSREHIMMMALICHVLVSLVRLTSTC